MKKKKMPLWKHEERALCKAKSRKWRKKSLKIIAMLDSKPGPEHQKSRAEYIYNINEVRKCE